MNSSLRKPKWRIFSKVLASTIVLSLTLLISPGYAAATPAPAKRVLIGITPWVGHLSYIIAEEEGFFLDEKLDAKVVVFPDATSRYNAFKTGNIEFCTGDVWDHVLMAATGYPITLIMETDWREDDKIITKSEFDNLGELKGKIVACEIGTIEYFFLLKLLEANGLRADDVTVINMTAWEGAVAFVQGTIDAVVTFEPYSSHILTQGKGKVAMAAEDFPGLFRHGLCVQNKILKENPEVAVKVIRCWFRALKWSEEHPDEYYEIANKRLFYKNPQTKENLIYSQSLIKMLKPDEIKNEMKDKGPLYQYCREILDFYYDQGMIDSKPDPANFINNELYLEALDAYYE